ncbi:hypothetical protein [Paracoccus sp. Ld10]|uniref:hypothetical protein n=1 Tax=Paracoccus sp. Ld10 TaxID=649158 RepID=UPI003870E1CF
MPNQSRSLAIVANRFEASRTFRNLALVGDRCRENLCLSAGISGAKVARELGALVGSVASRSNGTEFARRAILKWAEQNDVAWHDASSATPQQNASTAVLTACGAQSERSNRSWSSDQRSRRSERNDHRSNHGCLNYAKGMT